MLSARLGKKAVRRRNLGVEITNKEIRLAQISSNKSNQYPRKIFVHPVDLPDEAAILEKADKMSEELSMLYKNQKLRQPL